MSANLAGEMASKTKQAETATSGLAFILGVRLSYTGTQEEFPDAYEVLRNALHKKHELLKVGRKIYICADSFHFRQRTSFSVDEEDSAILAALLQRANGSESIAKHFGAMSQAVASTKGKFELRADTVEAHICFAEGTYV